MNIGHQAAAGAMWTIGLGLASRFVGLVGTVVITHFLSPAVMGEVAAATVLALTANWMSAWGFNQYVIVKGEEGHEAVFHATVLHLAFGFAALLVVLLAGGGLSAFLNAPNLGAYLPGMVAAVAIKRLTSIPDKLLMRQMRFRTVAIATATGEVVYVCAAVLLVMNTNLGGVAIVAANIVQALVVAAIEITAQGLRTWLTPVPWNWQRAREILRFGTPLGLESLLSEASRYWDKLAFSRLFGPQATGMYSLAYNLADLPATYVGEHVASVLFPTLVRSEASSRPRLFCRAFGLLLLITLPIAIGLAAVAHTLIELLLPAEWQPVAGFLVVLAAAGVFRPINSIAASLLMASERNTLLLAAEFTKVSVLLFGMWALSPFGQLASAATVALAMGVQAALLVYVLGRSGFPVRELPRQARGPLSAAIVLVAAVIATRFALDQGTGIPVAAQLVAEVLAGGFAYCLGAWIFARPAVNELIVMITTQIRGPRLPVEIGAVPDGQSNTDGNARSP
jgi:O-antigen/teichoic acid export membrane protein